MLQSCAAAQHGTSLIENLEIHDQLVAEGKMIRLPVRPRERLEDPDQ